MFLQRAFLVPPTRRDVLHVKPRSSARGGFLNSVPRSLACSPEVAALKQFQPKCVKANPPRGARFARKKIDAGAAHRSGGATVNARLVLARYAIAPRIETRAPQDSVFECRARRVRISLKNAGNRVVSPRSHAIDASSSAGESDRRRE